MSWLCWSLWSGLCHDLFRDLWAQPSLGEHVWLRLLFSNWHIIFRRDQLNWLWYRRFSSSCIILSYMHRTSNRHRRLLRSCWSLLQIWCPHWRFLFNHLVLRQASINKRFNDSELCFAEIVISFVFLFFFIFLFLFLHCTLRTISIASTLSCLASFIQAFYRTWLIIALTFLLAFGGKILSLSCLTCTVCFLSVLSSSHLCFF